VLCIDDNRDVADSEAELLRVVGFEACAYYGGAGALVEAADFLPGVCLIDLNMPGMDGDEPATRLRDLWVGEPPVLIAVTAMDGEAARRRIKATFDQHLVKPAGRPTPPGRAARRPDGSLRGRASRSTIRAMSRRTSRPRSSGTAVAMSSPGRHHQRRNP
jgi:CheY-like chemotaxis protein